MSVYITSKIDGESYCKTNGNFSRHLNKHNLTFQQYYETYVTGIQEICPICGNSKKFHQEHFTYSSTCGTRECAAKFRWENATPEEREHRSESSKKWFQNASPEELLSRQEKRIATNIEKYGVGHPMQSDTVKSVVAATNLERYGDVCPMQNDAVAAKAKATLMENYGVDHPMHSNVISRKVKDTNLERYGFESSLLNEGVRQKIKQTNLDMHGVEYASQNDIIRGKISTANKVSQNLESVIQSKKDTMMILYGVENPSQSEIVKQKKIDTSRKNYGVDNPSQSEVVKVRRRKTNLAKHGNEYYSSTRLPDDKLALLTDENWMVSQYNEGGVRRIMDLLQISKNTVHSYLRRTSIVRDRSSSFEKEVMQYLRSIYSGEIITWDRTILSGKEVDIYLPELKLAFECNGTYWHSDLNGKDNKYHLSKTIGCADAGIQLIHLWSHDWYNSVEKIKSLISGRLGANSRVYARKCVVADVTFSVASEFLVDNHRQGRCATGINIGLFADGKLVSVMAFGKSRYADGFEYELLRYCSVLGVNVVGGAGKLMSYFVEKYSPGSIISYCDRSMNNGGLYVALGFSLLRESPPAYHYTLDYNIVHNRLNFQKHKLTEKLEVFDDSLTAWQNMQNNGYDRIWDCGQFVYGWSSKSD